MHAGVIFGCLEAASLVSCTVWQEAKPAVPFEWLATVLERPVTNGGDVDPTPYGESGHDDNMRVKYPDS